MKIRLKQLDSFIEQQIEISNPNIFLLYEEIDEKLISESISQSVKIGEAIQEEKILDVIIENTKKMIAEFFLLNPELGLEGYSVSFSKSNFLSGIKKRIETFTKKSRKLPLRKNGNIPENNKKQ